MLLDVKTLADYIKALAEENKMLKESANAVQGEWVRKVKEYNDCDGHRVVYWYECDQCGARPPKDQWKNECHSNYCPNCGARMGNDDDDLDGLKIIAIIDGKGGAE